jgi:hypothetical protein
LELEEFLLEWIIFPCDSNVQIDLTILISALICNFFFLMKNTRQLNSIRYVLYRCFYDNASRLDQ